jgi:formiminoglutamase
MNAAEWLARESSTSPTEIAVLGAPISKASISPSNAWSTPPALRQALARFSTWDSVHSVDVGDIGVRDLGDVKSDRDEPDASAAHDRIHQACCDAYSAAATVVVIGGDNSLTRPAMQGAMQALPDLRWGLLTLDAHHDCRPLDRGSSNGTPVRELIEAGLPGNLVAQIGIQPFANDAANAKWADDAGIVVYGIEQVLADGIVSVVDDALFALRRAGATALHVDFDIDVADRAFAPACPASMPGGLTPLQLLAAAHRLGRQIDVAAADITEVDAQADVNGSTVRLAAATFMSFCSGVAARPRTERV